MNRRSVIAAAAIAVPAGAAGLSSPAFAHGSGGHPRRNPALNPPSKVGTPATAVASRSDRRPVAGGVYDAKADKTYISWGGVLEDNYVQEFNHRSGTWSAPVRVASGDNDSHNYPTMVLAGDGHILIFRGLHNKELWVARSPKPHAIDGVWTDVQIPEGLGATYPMPFKTDSGAIFVFIRETAENLDKKLYPTDFRPMKYVRSTDHGKTWKSSETLTGQRWNIAPQTRTDNMNEIYIGQLRYEPATRYHDERVAIVYTLAGGGPEGHLHDRYHKNLYYTYFTPKNGHFHSADGKDLGVKIDDAVQEQHLKIVDTPFQTVNPRSPDYISQVGTVVDNLPFVVWMQIDATAQVHTWSSVHVPGAGWQSHELGIGYRIRDIEEVDRLTWRVYGTPDLGTPGVLPNIDTFKLTLGTNLQHESTIVTPKPVQRIEVIGGYKDPARILATGNSTGRDVTIADGDVYVVGG